MSFGTRPAGDVLAFPTRKEAASSPVPFGGKDADLLAADLLARVIGILRGYDPDGADIYLPLSHISPSVTDRLVLGLGNATRCLTSATDEHVVWTTGEPWPVWCEWSIRDAKPSCVRLVIAGCPEGALLSADDDRAISDSCLAEAEQWLTEALERQLLATAVAS